MEKGAPSGGGEAGLRRSGERRRKEDRAQTDSEAIGRFTPYIPSAIALRRFGDC